MGKRVDEIIKDKEEKNKEAKRKEAALRKKLAQNPPAEDIDTTTLKSMATRVNNLSGEERKKEEARYKKFLKEFRERNKKN